MVSQEGSDFGSGRPGGDADADARYRIICGRCEFERVVDGVEAAFAAEADHRDATNSGHYLEMYLVDA
jgi:hypothetical protein